MSVRVHAIAKQVNKSSKELIEILTERGYEIKSASASIDNITAQSIIGRSGKRCFECLSYSRKNFKPTTIEKKDAKSYS